ncbi:maleylpyruvate isomerase N-terminal domain-containing protein [Actinoallomurus sp. NPDC052308]|uniref:maleylpyruvate isomerase N-terminal domain-containing protein n=1 Tax=Actinoallomurus sp. NPDC052308 TaxID=3155530 RepID=UPI0034410C52
MVNPASVLEVAFGDLIDLVENLDDEAAWRPTGCAGWVVRDLVFHLLGDAQRALVALGTPATGPADVDAVTYWRAWKPGDPDADPSRRNTRIMASVWSGIRPLADLYAETARAVLVHARRFEGDELVTTQGHTLTVGDLLATLAVEAGVHQLDLTAHLPGPPPAPAVLRLVRDVLDGLIGRPVAQDWDDAHYVRVGTGRTPLTAAERESLGPVAELFPVFG